MEISPKEEIKTKICEKCWEEKTLEDFTFREDRQKYYSFCKVFRCTQKNLTYALTKGKHRNRPKNNPETKICNKCGVKKVVDEFHYRNDANNYRHQCKSCCRLRNQNYFKLNKEKCYQATKKWENTNKDRVNFLHKRHRIKNKEKIAIGRRALRKHKRIIDPQFKILDNLRRRTRKALTFNSAAKRESTVRLLGCSVIDFKRHLESKFTQDMSWDNYGAGGWEIDHVIPCSTFNLENQDEQRKCFHYTNQQPLWATTRIAISHGADASYIGNKEKGDRILNISPICVTISTVDSGTPKLIGESQQGK